MAFDFGSLIGGAASGVGNYLGAREMAKQAKKDRKFQKQVYSEGVERLSPWVQGGGNALSEYLTGIGIGGSGDDFIARYQDSPEYRLRYDSGMDLAGRAVDRQASAAGGLNSGNRLMALQDRGTRIGGDLVGNYLARLMNMSEAGRSAAGGTNTFAGSQAGQVANAGYNVGNANAAGFMGMGNTVNNTLADYLQGQQQQAAYGGGGRSTSGYGPVNITPNSYYGGR